MNLSKRFGPVLGFIILSCVMCSKDESTNPESDPVQGRITAVAVGITGQNGSVYAVTAYASDWSPGSNDPVIAGFMTNISSDDFSLTQGLCLVDSLSPGGYSTEEKVFEPGTYSVVFFVSPQGSPPQHYAEVRVSVDGDMTVNAPTWANWVHF